MRRQRRPLVQTFQVVKAGLSLFNWLGWLSIFEKGLWLYFAGLWSDQSNRERYLLDRRGELFIGF
jgi:hypothetical protein